MVTAIVLIQGERDKLPETAEKLTDVPGVKEVYSVAGDYDLVAIVRVKEHEQLADVVTKNLLKMEGISRTNTLIAFKSYSRKDLERMWEIGLESLRSIDTEKGAGREHWRHGLSPFSRREFSSLGMCTR